MANTQYGVVGSLGETILTEPSSHANAPVYIGVAPLHLAESPAEVNKPVLINSYEDAVKRLGFAADSDKYDLCKAVDAHFLNTIQPVGPICCINVYDPTADQSLEDSDTTASVVLNGGVGYIDDQDCAISTVVVSDKTQGEDYKIILDAESLRIKITDLTGTMTSPVSVTYKKAVVLISADDIVGMAYDDGRKTGIKATGYVFQMLGIVPAFLCAPKWGGDEAVHAALVTASQAVSGRFYAMVPNDVPITHQTITEAMAGKIDARMNGEMDLPSWPMEYKGQTSYPLSILTIVAAMQTDLKNGGVPYESADNKRIDIDGTCLTLDKPILLDIDQADKLKAAGLRTALLWGGVWRLWGSHTGAYMSDGSSDKRSMFDCGMRMLYYVLNTFTLRYFDDIGKPMTRNKLNSIVTDVNAWLDGLVTMGALLYAKAEPVAVESMDDLIMGRVRFKLRATNTPPLSLISAVLSYTDTGLKLMLEEG